MPAVKYNYSKKKFKKNLRSIFMRMSDKEKQTRETEGTIIKHIVVFFGVADTTTIALFIHNE